MKYTLSGYDQETVIEINNLYPKERSVGINELIILRWFKDFQSTAKMKSFLVDGEEYFWVHYESVLEAFPLLDISKQTLAKYIFKTLVNNGFLKSKTIKNNEGTFSAYAFGEHYAYLEARTAERANDTGSQNYQPPLSKATTPVGTKVRYKDSSIKNSSIKKLIKEKNTKKEKKYSSIWHKKITELSLDRDLEKELLTWVSSREKKKQPLTDRSFNMAMKALETHSGGNLLTKIAMARYSVDRGYPTFYEVNKALDPYLADVKKERSADVITSSTVPQERSRNFVYDWLKIGDNFKNVIDEGLSLDRPYLQYDNVLYDPHSGAYSLELKDLYLIAQQMPESEQKAKLREHRNRFKTAEKPQDAVMAKEMRSMASLLLTNKSFG